VCARVCVRARVRTYTRLIGDDDVAFSVCVRTNPLLIILPLPICVLQECAHVRARVRACALV